MIALLLSLPALVQQPAPRASEVGDERPAILLRTPDKLPRAQQGTWDQFLSEEGREEVLRSFDAEVLGWMDEADKAYRGHRYPTTLENLYPLLEDQPDFPPALMLLGTTYFRLRRYEDCRLVLARFVEVAPGDLWRTQALGHAHYSLGDYVLASQHYEAVLAAMPEAIGPSPEALRGLALCHMRRGDPDRALELLDQVLELRPNHAEAFTFKARILYDEERLEESRVAADKARELSPFEPQAWFLAMRILYDLELDEEAAEAEAQWKVLDRVAQERRGLEMRLRFLPGQYGLILRLCELDASIGDLPNLRRRFADLLMARPPDVPEVEVRIFVLDQLLGLDDLEGARVAAVGLEESCPGEVAAWKRLERFYGLTRDRVNQVRCAGEAARLTASSKD